MKRGERGDERRVFMQTVQVHETFTSIQGESSYAGMPCFFVRCAGCNLACSYCDTAAARTDAGQEMTVEALVERRVVSGAPMVEITGGEPLLQPGCIALARRFRDVTEGPVLIETNGSVDIAAIPDGVIAVMDIKCPGSGCGDVFEMRNLAALRPYDEVKFVVSGAEDFEWASRFCREHDLVARCHAVFFSPVFGAVEPAVLAKWIMDDRLAVRLQLQLHKVLGVP